MCGHYFNTTCLRWLDWFPGVDPMKSSYLMRQGCVNIEDSDCSRLQVVLWADKGNES